MIAVSTIIANVKKELGSFYSTEAHTDTDILRYINSAARAIVIARNFGFNKYSYEVTVTDSTTEYTIPYQIETFYILDEQGDEVNYYTFEDYYRLSDKTDCVMIEEDKLVSEKTGTFNIYYRGYPDTIVSKTGNLNIPEHFFDLVVLQATYYGYMDIRAFDKANNKKNIFNGMVSDMSKRESDKKPLKTKRLNKSNSSQW